MLPADIGHVLLSAWVVWVMYHIKGTNSTASIALYGDYSLFLCE